MSSTRRQRLSAAHARDAQFRLQPRAAGLRSPPRHRPGPKKDPGSRVRLNPSRAVSIAAGSCGVGSRTEGPRWRRRRASLAAPEIDFLGTRPRALRSPASRCRPRGRARTPRPARCRLAPPPPPHRATQASEPVPPDNTGNLQAPAVSRLPAARPPERLEAATIPCDYGKIGVIRKRRALGIDGTHWSKSDRKSPRLRAAVGGNTDLPDNHTRTARFQEFA